jgi:radical SAM superfamily enzyme YgiQ (UPF0313 family)
VKILLVQPSPFEPGRLGLENVLWLSEPVALTSLAAMVPEHEVRILDMRLEPEDVLNKTLLEFRPDLVGTSAMTTDCYQSKAVLAIARGTLGDQVFTIVGGHHPTMAPGDYEEPEVDAVCVGEGEETFQELVMHLSGGGDRRKLQHVRGLRFRDEGGTWVTTVKRAQVRDLDTFPAPARALIPERYRKQYFFAVASPMASIFTSRGCSFDCNFCAIWEFYERRTRYMSAKVICDRLEQIDEDFVFFLDDNFLTNKKRLEALCDEIAARKIKKFFGTQGRTDFISDNPELMRRLRDAGLCMVLSGYESNDDDALAALQKSSTREMNVKAAEILRDLGIVSTGIFMVRPEFEEKDFDALWNTINELGVAIPLVTILTPLPGTQMYRKMQDQLLTRDVRLFDLLHAVTPTRLPRRRFYEKYSEWHEKTWAGAWRGILPAFYKRPRFAAKALPGAYRWLQKARWYEPVVRSPESHLRDEIGIIPEHAPPKALPPAAPAEVEMLREVGS